jgi:hypothetical protein
VLAYSCNVFPNVSALVRSKYSLESSFKILGTRGIQIALKDSWIFGTICSTCFRTGESKCRGGDGCERSSCTAMALDSMMYSPDGKRTVGMVYGRAGLELGGTLIGEMGAR